MALDQNRLVDIARGREERHPEGSPAGRLGPRALGAWPRPGRTEAGQSILESALWLVVVVFLLGGLIDITFYGIDILKVGAAAREGARFGVDGDPDLYSGDANCSTTSDYYEQIRCVAMFSMNSDGLWQAGPAAQDDIVVSAISFEGGAVTDRQPSPSGWSWRGARTSRISNEEIAARAARVSNPDSGLVVVEVFYDHTPFLSLRYLFDLLGPLSNPMTAYGVAIMPVPAME